MAAEDTSCAPPGDCALARHQMVEKQLRRRGIRDARVLQAMGNVPREVFVPSAFRNAAYEDRPLPIGQEQTISQPFVVAFMAECLQLEGTERLLEIGTGSGYGAAVLSRLVASVHTVERIPELAELARRALAEVDCDNVHVHIGDGSLGLREHAPYDAICVTAGGKALPNSYVQQLAPNGRIVMPLGDQPRSQTMHRFCQRAYGLSDEVFGGFAFVPLVGEWGWEETA